MVDPRKLKDPRPVARLKSFTELMKATVQVTLPCGDGDEEWTSEDPGLQQRAALCQACGLLLVCRSYALASGEGARAWGGLTPAARRKLRRRIAA